MKKIEIVTRPENVEGLKKILTQHGSQGMTVYSVMGCGNQKGYLKHTDTERAEVNLLPKMCVFSVIPDNDLEVVLSDIYEVLGSGHFGDGKVFVYDAVDAMRIRTGERGESAL